MSTNVKENSPNVKGKARSSKKSGSGRPKGAKSKPATTVRHDLARCLRCQGTEHRVIKKIAERRIEGNDRDGNPFNRVVWRRVACKSCGQHRTQITRHFDPPGSDPTATDRD